MRRSSPLVPILLICLAIANQWASSPVLANFHTEGGNFKLPSPSSTSKHLQPANDQQQQYYDLELANADELLKNRQQQQQQPVTDYAAEPQQQPVDDSALAGIVHELNQQMRRDSQAYDDERQTSADLEDLPTLEELMPGLAEAEKARNEGVAAEKSPVQSNFRQRQQELASGANAEITELTRLSNKFKELTQSKQEQQQELVPATPEEDETVEKPTNQQTGVEKPLTAQKKGQSEYVEFIEPMHSNKLSHKEYMEKRVASDHHSHHYRAFNLVSSSGNVIFIAFVTMCCVFSVVGVVGGMYYYNHVKTSKEDPFDDFTRYSPAGPGRDKLKKGRNGGGAGGVNTFSGFAGEKGDESLAYKAQLHHYQQTKQKIIGEQAGVGGVDVDASDKSDDEADLEHNFSVYECPGLAPTGDIEVQNPNFVESPLSGKKQLPTILSPN